ncbi:hypothetical protein [Agreia sp. COWG]|uniref:hypothetical protein n=1 Tax=Agreia sp. COWG TaxID=2773266 RepID=UPI0019257A85|nr:hypothetical protein [Agreia sp. COWG]CAD5989203.1 protein of unknown function [Agreia sp. COWG]
MKVDWIVTEVVRDDVEHTALYVLRNQGELHTATIEARPEYESVAVTDDDVPRSGWIRYSVTWSRSGATYPGQFNSLSLSYLVSMVSEWEARAAGIPAVRQQISDLAAATDRLHFAAIENVHWGVPITEQRLQSASDAYESSVRHMNEHLDRFMALRPKDTKDTAGSAPSLDPIRADVLMASIGRGPFR